jgi:hypothetical protein
MIRLSIGVLCIIVMITACGGSQYQYVPPPTTFHEADLVGTWQAIYDLTSVDTITLKADGTYQQIFKAPASNYYYESPWNKWHIEYSASGKPKLHLEGMRYYAYTIEIGEGGGRLPNGTPILFHDIDEEKTLEITDKVILRIKGDESSPRGIVLRHMHFDLDMSPPYFVLIDDNHN